MNISEILRALLDKLDQIENSDADVLSPVNAEPDHQEKMMPPLQQKQELLKKAVGVKSEYDEQDCGCEPDFNNELEIMKRNAGIIFASENDPLE